MKPTCLRWAVRGSVRSALASKSPSLRPLSQLLPDTRSCPAIRSSHVVFYPVCRQFHAPPARNDAEGASSEKASGLNQRGLDFQEKEMKDKMEEANEKKIRTPWHREGSDTPPVARQRSAGAMTKGKLLTTPSRLLKLILPLTTLDENSDRKDIEPLALLVHPQQPLSYLERLIQSEIPRLANAKGEQRSPKIHFRAEDAAHDEDSLVPKKKSTDEDDDTETTAHGDGDATHQTGVIGRPRDARLRGGPGEGGVESYSGLGQEAQSSTHRDEKKWVRWSSSTEIGDFIRDAARGKEFAVEIEGAPNHIYVGVPSFNDRTHYLRAHLRKTSRKIADMATVKKECDLQAHRKGQRVALGGFGLLAGWWYIVYRITFETDLGWDTMEPVTYLVGLSTIIGGYGWFLYHNREVSYRSALNLTISRNQTKLYNARGFDLQRWETLVDEGNALRKEIKAVAREYDVEWDEKVEEQSEVVTEALEEQREKKDEDDDDKKDEKRRRKKAKDKSKEG